MAETVSKGTPHAPGGSSVHRSTGVSATVEVALLDQSGVIVSVNDAWTAFGASNGAEPDRIGVGVSYLGVCDAASDDRYARDVASAVRTALDGDLPAPARVALPCHAPGTSRWFDVLVSSRFDDGGACVGATVTLSPARDGPGPSGRPDRGDRPAPGPAMPAYYPERSEWLGEVFAQLLLDRAPLGIVVVDDQGMVVRAGRAAEQLFGHGPDGLVGTPVARALPDLDPAADPTGAEDLPAGAPGSVRTVDGLRADGSVVSVEIRVGHLPLSRGTGTVVLVREAPPGAAAYPPGHVVYLDHEIDDVVRDLDEVARQLFDSGLTVAGSAAAHRDDRALMTTLIDVTEDLDRAVRDLRTVAHRLQQEGRRPWFPRGTGPRQEIV